MAKNKSFLPEDYLDRKIARRTNLVCVSLMAVMIVSLVGAFFVQRQQMEQTAGEGERINAQFVDRAEQLDQIKLLQSQQEQMMGKAEIVRSLAERIPRSIILAEMINAMPASLSLLEFNLETKIVKPGTRPQTAIQRETLNNEERANEEQVEIAPTEVGIQVIGIAPSDEDVSIFMENLNRHPLFVSVGLEYIEGTKIEGTDLRRFRVVMQLNQDLVFDQDDPTDLQRELQQNPMDDEIQFNGQAQATEPEAPGVSSVPTPTD